MLIRLLRHKLLQVIIPSLTGSYYLCLDVWGDKIELIKNYQNFHEKAFFILIGASLVILCFKGISELIEDKVLKNQNDFIQHLVILTSKVVREKLKRFKHEATTLRSDGSTFKKITKPNIQINLLLTETEILFREQFGINKEQLGITIIQKKPKKPWDYKYKTNHDWNHTKPSNLFSKPSAAKECYEQGEIIFYPDKLKAQKDGHYQFSDRDSRHKNKGSIFCYPVKANTPNHDVFYIISIATYDKCICPANDHQQIKAIKTILTDICYRIDLELTLEAIKDWHLFNKPTTEGV